MEQGNLEVAKALLDRKAKLNASATNEEGKPFLHYFIQKDNGKAGIELLKKLFATYAVNFELKNSKGETCLHVAADQYDQNFVILLLEQQPNLVNLTDHLGQTALHRAYNWEPLRKLLIEKGADPSITDNKGLTPEALCQQKQSEKIQRERARHNALNYGRSNW